MFCSQCGKSNESGLKFCQGCGGSLEGSNQQPASSKSPVLALILSLIIIGLGQFYNGEVKKGLIMLGLGILTGIFSMGIGWAIVAIWSAWDAYSYAKRMG